MCNNFDGSYSCSCFTGYQLAPDSNLTCIGEILNKRKTFTSEMKLFNEIIDIITIFYYPISQLLCFLLLLVLLYLFMQHFLLFIDLLFTYFPDIDECLDNWGGCPDLCNNTIGSFTCIPCPTNYVINVDHSACLHELRVYLSSYPIIMLG